MVTLVICCSALTVTGFIIGWMICDNHLFWDRQNYMEKLNRKF